MSNLKVEVLLKAVDQATRPFKAVQNASKSLSNDILGSQATLKDLNAQAGKIEGFRKSSAQMAVTSQKLKDAKAEAAALAIQQDLRESAEGLLRRLRQGPPARARTVPGMG